jgi:RNA polymerase sigma-70 factor (ECF subfamily)
MLIPSTNASLLLALQKDSHREEAWGAFQAHYRDVILGWCRRRDLPQDSAEDLTQEILLKLFQELPTYDPAKGHFRSWLKAVVNNALSNYWRHRRRHPEHFGVGGTGFLEQMARLESPETADELSGVIEEHGKTIAAEVLRRVQARVEEKTWQAFYRTLVEERPAADVAAELGLTVGAVYKYKCRVKEMVKEEYTYARPPS